jgi:hypothetical protein
MTQSARMVLISFLLCSTAYGQSVVTFTIPKSRESIDQKAELRYCSQWLNFVGGNDARVDLLLELLDKDSLDVPYRWRSAFLASRETDHLSLEGGGINAATLLPIRRNKDTDDLGEVLLLKKKLTIRLPESHGPGGGYSVPSAVLDRDDCYIIDSQENSRIVLTKLETTAGTKKWEASFPLFYSLGQGTGPGYNDGFQDIRFLDRGGKRVMQSWNHYAGEFMFVELDCSDGSIETWFSSKIKDNMNIR